MANSLTLEQQRATSALRAVESAKDCEGYQQEVDALPAMIRINGLGQAVATLLANANGVETNKSKACKQLVTNLTGWLCDECPISPYRSDWALIKNIVEGHQKDYARAQAEALAYLVWLKKFARAHLKPHSPSGDRTHEKGD